MVYNLLFYFNHMEFNYTCVKTCQSIAIKFEEHLNLNIPKRKTVSTVASVTGPMLVETSDAWKQASQ